MGRVGKGLVIDLNLIFIHINEAVENYTDFTTVKVKMFLDIMQSGHMCI